MLDGEYITNSVPKSNGSDWPRNIKYSKLLDHNRTEPFQDSDCNSRIRTQALLLFSFQCQRSGLFFRAEGPLKQPFEKGEGVAKKSDVTPDLPVVLRCFQIAQEGK